ncbi:MAG: DUF4124 domain-containing protein [Xanthomonadales bacterium]|nr:DUF4124 domain-containing protein [Xanthomonadales bacterium]
MKLVRLTILGMLPLLVFGLIGSTLALAEVYRWVDEDGVVHYSEVPPPPGQQAETQDVPATPEEVGEIPLSGIDFDGDAPVEPDVDSAADLTRQQIAVSREQARAEEEALAAVCRQARARLEQIEPNRRVYFTNEEGETERMDDEQRVSEVAQLRELVEKSCP